MSDTNETKDPRGLTVIEGRKGKGGGRTPVEDRDSLRSTQIARVVDAIGEGECEGLANGLKDVFLDGVPIQNADGSLNFEGVTYAWTAGTQGQPAIPALSGVEAEIAVQVEVKKATPIVRSISDPAVDAVRITIAVPQLTNQDMTTGDLHGSLFEWVIEVQSNGGGYVERYRDTLSGKCTTTYTRSVMVGLAGTGPHDIRVKRITDDSTQSNVVNAFTWQSYTEVIQRKLRYPNTCMSYLQVDAQQFARIPVRAWRWRGLRVKVPTNYNPVTRVYTGTWDGTFKMAWTNNPAWCLYAMVTNARWGLGNHVDEAYQNKWSLYKIGQYCDGLVPDGKGGVEPRFTFNWVFTTREQAYKVLQDLAAVFRGLAWWANSNVEYAQDAPQDAQLLYAAANVVDGTFTYQDTSEKTFHSVVIC
jgi:predicted phage tail protein